MTRVLTAVAVLLAVSALAFAQEPEDAADEPRVEAPERDEDAAPGSEDASPDVFIPTEEISEDASVPFPVDI
jgi:hypothetical protein